MNIKQIIAATLLLTAAGASFADSAAPLSAPGVTKSRADVIAELKQAKDQGLLATNDADFSSNKSSISGEPQNRTIAQLKSTRNKNN